MEIKFVASEIETPRQDFSCWHPHATIPCVSMSSPLASAIAGLASADPSERKAAADAIYRAGRTTADGAVSLWWQDAELSGLLLGPSPVVTVGLAGERATFGRIRVAH